MNFVSSLAWICPTSHNLLQRIYFSWLLHVHSVHATSHARDLKYLLWDRSHWGSGVLLSMRVFWHVPSALFWCSMWFSLRPLPVRHRYTRKHLKYDDVATNRLGTRSETPWNPLCWRTIGTLGSKPIQIIHWLVAWHDCPSLLGCWNVTRPTSAVVVPCCSHLFGATIFQGGHGQCLWSHLCRAVLCLGPFRVRLLTNGNGWLPIPWVTAITTEAHWGITSSDIATWVGVKKTKIEIQSVLKSVWMETPAWPVLYWPLAIMQLKPHLAPLAAFQ